MKFITMYLPQFHRVHENDLWWGEGFTDWVSTREATPKFDGHYQPHIPKNNNYYDLLDKKTMEWQADLMKKYGIDGQCIYHYWFKDGRKILEKPAENLLEWKDIDMPFCFYWANGNWIRTWSKLDYGNAWDYKRETSVGANNDGVLLEQDYGDRNEWEKHFNYLLDFFLDDRYIKKDGKPVFVIYSPDKIDCLIDMLELWGELAREAGFHGIYVIGANAESVPDNVLSKKMVHEPKIALDKIKEGRRRVGLKIYEYSDVWDGIIQDAIFYKNDIISGYVGYDDTPRRDNKGSIIINQNPQTFEKYLKRLVRENINRNNDLLFINAWNEWGEGMHLEPDEKWGESYLEAVKSIKEELNTQKFKTNIQANQLETEEILRIENQKLNNKIVRYKFFWETLDRILDIRDSSKSINKTLLEKDIKTVAIYGMGMIGRHLVALFEESGISIKYAIDIKADNKCKLPFEVLFPEEKLPEVDLLIITVDYEYKIIKESLQLELVKRIMPVKSVLKWFK